jgi:hypothetical protein
LKAGSGGALEVPSEPTVAFARDSFGSATGSQGALDAMGLARLQILAGNKAAAKSELEKLAALGPDYQAQAEVARLLRQLGA